MGKLRVGRRRIAAGILLLEILGAAALRAAGSTVTARAAYIGSWGLEVSIGRNCAAPDLLEIPAGSGPIEGLYEACLQLTAEGVTVTGAGATLRAGDAVALGEGFTVPSGIELTTEIERGMATEFASVHDPSPIDETVYHASFYVDRGSLSLGAGDEIEHFVAYSASGTRLFRLVFRTAGGGGEVLHLAARQDGGGWIETAPGQGVALPPGWTKLEVSWAAGDGTGELLVSVNDGAFVGLTGLDNDGYAVEAVRWGAIDGSIAASSGVLWLDGFNSWR